MAKLERGWYKFPYKENDIEYQFCDGKNFVFGFRLKSLK